MLTILTLTMVMVAPGDEVLARVDGRAVTGAQLNARAALTSASGAPADALALVQDLVNDELLAREGYRQGLEKSPVVVAAFEAARLKVAAETFLEKQVYGNVKVEESQLKFLFHESGDSARVRMIIVASEDEARALLGRLEQGAKFADEAKHSLDPIGQQKKGDYGELTRAQIEEAARALVFSTPLGKPVGPVKLALGVAVVVVDSRVIADEAKFPARKAEIAQFAEAQTRVMMRRHILDQLRAKYKVTVDQPFLKSTGTRLTASPVEADRALARVGGRTVTYGQVLAQQQKSFGGAMGSHMSGPRVKEELAWALVDDVLGEEAAVAAGFGKEPAALEAARRAERDAVIRELANRTRAAVPQPTPAMLQSFLDAHAADYTRPATRACSHIVVKDQGEAKTLRGQIARGDRFEDVAAEHSLDRGSAGRGGLLGELDDRVLEVLAKERGEGALVAAMRAGQPNVVSEPVKGTAGWHLVRCGASTPAKRLALTEVQPQLTERAWFEERQAAVGRLVARLREAAKVSIDEAAIQRFAATMKAEVHR